MRHRSRMHRMGMAERFCSWSVGNGRVVIRVKGKDGSIVSTTESYRSGPQQFLVEFDYFGANGIIDEIEVDPIRSK